MKYLKILIVLCLGLIGLTGCGGDNTYSPDYTGNADFLIAVFNANAATTGNGVGKIKNDAAHPFAGAPGSKMTILVAGVGGFKGTVNLSTGQETGNITAGPPSVTNAVLNGSNFVASEFTYSIGGSEKPAKQGVKAVTNGTLMVTATSGSKTHTYKVFISNDSGEFKITVFNADAETVGSGQGQTPNDATHPFTGAPGSKMTIVVESVGPFAGPVSLSVGSDTGGIESTSPNPSSVSLVPGQFRDSEVSYVLLDLSRKRIGKAPITGTFVVTATSGTVSHTYTVFVNYDPGDFSITVYNANALTVGDGTGFTPNSASNRFFGQPGDPLAIVVKPIGNFSGTVNLSVGNETGGIFGTGPVPTSVTIDPTTSKDSEFSYSFGGGKPLKGTRGIIVGQSITVTATSGSLVHTYQAFFNVGD